MQLRLDTTRVPGLTDAVLGRLRALAGRRMTAEGALLLTSREHRTQDRNREAARARLSALIRDALVAPTIRRPTRPTKGSKERRLEAKGVRAGVKQNRGRVTED